MKKSNAVTRNEVARAAQVSAATVSYVVNNGPRPVAPETHKKVLEVIERLGYKPNAMARNLRMQHSTTFGLIVPDIHNPYFAEVARGVEQMASENGLTMVLCHSDYKLERELHYVEILQTERSAGIIWLPATNSTEPATQIAKYRMPLVVLDRVVSGVGSPSIIVDNYLGGYLATKHLIDLGHRRIGCITRPIELQHSSERIRGFREALRENSIDIDESFVVKGGFRFEDGCVAAKQIIQNPARPTAIFSYNDFMAIGALRAAYELGLKVPDDISIIGFDDIPQAAFTCPALTTIFQPKLEMGREGVALLLEEINEPTNPIKKKISLPVKLIIRETTAPPSW